MVENKVDNMKPGVYEVTYQVTNSVGESTTITVRITVLDKVEPALPVPPITEIPSTVDPLPPLKVDPIPSVDVPSIVDIKQPNQKNIRGKTIGLVEEKISDADKNERLPKTGYKSDIYFLLFGILLVVSALFFLWQRRSY